jgi:hypothetical protein
VSSVLGAAAAAATAAAAAMSGKAPRARSAIYKVSTVLGSS